MKEWRHRHLLGIADLSADEITQLLDLADTFVEINTRRATSRTERETDLAEALAFTRLYLAAPVAEI